jgi:hypothetical protein
MPRPVRITVLASLAVGAACATGCAPDPGTPSVVDLRRGDYPRAFEAALKAASDDGLEPVVVDRALGVIETDSRAAGSFLEPWRTDNAGLGDTLAHTVNFERRRVRFEFVPEPFDLTPQDPAGALQGPALPGSDRAEGRFDLESWSGPVQLRTWVMVDRQFRPNQRFGTWTLAASSYSTDPLAAPDPKDPATKAPTEWTPIGRDVQYERRLTARVLESLRGPSDGAATPADPGANPSD